MAYKDVPIRDTKKPSGYHYTQRRAAILQFIKEVGHPGLISQTELAKEYGVSQAQISHDFKAIKSEVVKHIGVDTDFITEIVYHKSVKELVKHEKYREACQILDWYNNWLFVTGRKKNAEQGKVTPFWEEINQEYERIKKERLLGGDKKINKNQEELY